MAQGGAFVHNLFAGRFIVQSELSRITPYHFPHETAMAGFSSISSGDDRYYNNIFLGDGETKKEPVPVTFFEHLPLKPREVLDDGKTVMDGVPDDSICYLYPVGLGSYNKHPNANDKQLWEYSKEELIDLGDAAKDFFVGNAILPVAADGNLYLNDALPSRHEPNAIVFENSGFDIKTDLSTVTVTFTVKDAEHLSGTSVDLVSTDVLGKSYHADMAYEKADGSTYRFDTDFFGNKRTEITPGPFGIVDGVVVEV